ncbi:MAG: phosphonoacetaldehyde hydrolase [Burkholderiales bacterium]|nr:phosphonoacetaldehyde hydrolase [Burkholderiales bacterium]
MAGVPVEVAIFDWAGTLVDFGSCAPVEAMRAAFAAFGIRVPNPAIRAHMGLAKRDHAAHILAMPEVARAWVERHGEPDDFAVDRLYAAYLERQADVIAEYSRPIPGVADALASLRRRGVRIGSTTGYPRAIIAPVADLARGAGVAPDVLVACDEVPRPRPGPGQALAVAVALGASDVRHCVKVDDAPAGIAEGLAAGMYVIGVAATGNGVGMPHAEFAALPLDERAERLAAATRELAAAGAHRVIGSVADLPAVLAGLAAGASS